MDKKADLGTAPIGKLLFRLAIPTVVAQLINMLYNIVDRIYIGRIPEVGSLALTGVGVCMPLIMIVSAFAAMAGGGGAPRASIFMGKGQNEDAEKTMAGCFSLLCIIAVVLTGVLLAFSENLLLAFGASKDTIGFAVDYMKIYAIGTLFVQLTLGMNAFITAQGFAKQGMLSVLIGAMCNIALDPVFIFGFGMGVKGAALATIISQAASAAWVLLFLTGKTTILKLKIKNLNLKPSIVFPCVALGMATFIMQSTESVISVCFNTSLQKYGGDVAVGAMTILTSVMQFAMLPMQGIGQGAQPIMSFNYGAGDAGRVKKTFRLLLTVSLSYSLVIWACIMLMPSVFAGIFTPDTALLDFTTKALRIYCAGLGLFGIQIACQMAFVSLGQALCSMTVAIMRKFVLLLPLIYLMPNLVADQTMGVYMAEPVADILAVTFTAILFFFVFRKAMRKLEEKKLAE